MKGNQLLSLFVLAVLAVWPLQTAHADFFIEPVDPTVYLLDGVIGVATSAPSASVDSQPTSLTVVENKNLFSTATEATDGEHEVETSAGTVTFVTADLLPGETYRDQYVTIVANEADWGRTGVIVTDSDRYVNYQFTGYGYATSLPNNTEWWDYSSLSWSSEAVWGFYTAIRIKKPYKIYLPAVVS